MKHETDDESGLATAAEWFVAIDSGPVDPETDREFAAWLDRDVDHERALECCEAAMRAAAELERDPELTWAFAELPCHEEPTAARNPPSDSAGWLTKPGFAWATATAVGLLIAFVLLVPHVARQPGDSKLQLRSGVASDTRVPVPAHDTEPPNRRELLGNSLRRAAPLESTVTITYTPLPNSIAVLPFESRGPNPYSQSLAIAVHEEI